MEKILSVCGLLCNECKHYKKECNSCHVIRGSTFWAKEMMPDKVCPIFKCCFINKKFINCGQCKDLPCKIFDELKDPNLSDEQHHESIRERVIRLNKE
jgi:hypothetical protein